MSASVADGPRRDGGRQGYRVAARLGLVRVLLVCLLLVPAAAAQDLVHNHATVDAQFAAWEADHPGLVERFQIGSSVLGTPLHGIRVTGEESTLSTGAKRPIYIDGGHHGNEYLGVQIVMYYLEDLLGSLDSPGTQALLRDHEIHAVPIINPDGVLRDTRYNARLVDLNRNYDFGWSPCALPCILGGGERPASEPEIQANVAYLTALSPDIWISTHTGIETLFWPQGNADVPGDPFVPHAPDIDMFETMEAGFENATNGRIDAFGGPAAAVGSAEDFGYGVLGVPSYVYEVHVDQFYPAYPEPMRSMLADQLAGMHFLVDNAWRMGAWVEVTPEGATNHGWGPARNVTVASDAGTFIIDVPAGATVPVEAAGPATWSYPALLVETSRTRHHSAVLPAAVDPAAVPFPLVLSLVAVALALRRQEAALACPNARLLA